MTCNGPRIDFMADGVSLPIASGSLGGVLCSHVLEHVAKPEYLVAEVHRALRVGGMAYFTFLDTYPYHAAKGKYPDYHRFKVDALELLLADFAEVRVLRGGGPLLTASAFAPRLIRRMLIQLAKITDQHRDGTITPVRYVVAVR